MRALLLLTITTLTLQALSLEESVDYALKHLPTSDPIIEIGSFCGLSINVMTYYKAKYNVENRLITCDRWNFEGAITGTMVGQSSVSHAEYRAYAKDTFLRNVKMFSEKDLPYTIEMFSDEFFQAWAKSQHVSDVFERPIQLGGNISFCYIDGNHSYEYVKRDFEHCHQFLVPQGFILFDDSADGSRWHEINQMVNEVAQSQQYELIIKNPNYFFRKK